MNDSWNPAQYWVFADERSRPFFELVGRIGAEAPAHVVDLGCGHGELTATLARRWPKASVEGIDSSTKMISAARKLAAGHPGGPAFAVGDLADWAPDAPVDVIVSNAVLHWVPEHRELLPRWVRALAPGGWLAFQVPGNADAPSHALLRELCRSPRWLDRLDSLPLGRPVGDPAEYFGLLAGQGCRVDAWETTYLHVLQGENAVLEWVKGTALRPVIAALGGDGSAATAEFIADYAGLLHEAYPPGPNGTLFPFRRIFVVASRDQTNPGQGAPRQGAVRRGAAGISFPCGVPCLAADGSHPRLRLRDPEPVPERRPPGRTPGGRRPAGA